jgi:hypothetical protein
MIIAPKKFGGQNSAYRHLNMKGAFGNEGALRFYGDLPDCNYPSASNQIVVNQSKTRDENFI